MKKDNSFLKAGAILVLSGFAVKVLSAAYRIPLTRMMGASLMGVYSSVLNVFMPFFAFATSGIIPAISRFTAKLAARQDNAGIVFLKKQAQRLYLLTAAAMTALYLVFSRFYSKYTGENIFWYGAVLLAPCIVMASQEMVYKGLSQGRMKMHITAAANIIESGTKTAAGIFLVYFIVNNAARYPVKLTVPACLLSVTVSAFVCYIYLFVSGRGPQGTGKPKNITTKRQLLSMSLPVSASALVISFVNFFDTAFCLPIIKNLPYTEIVKSFDGASFMGAEDVSMYLFGIYQGMVLTVFNLVPAVLASAGAACLPVMARADSVNDGTYLSRQSNRLFMVTSFISIPASVYIFCFRNDIITFLFGTTQGQTVIASELIVILVAVCPLACFVSAFNSVINSCGKSHIIFRILLTASLVRCVLSGVLVSLPQINIKAFALAADVFYLIIFVLSWVYISKLGVKINITRVFIHPSAAAVALMAVIKLTGFARAGGIPVFSRLLLSGTVFCCGYVITMYVTGFSVDI
ncbi:MAG: hypothetical protein E7484_06390 [Ruminococcaceae bacterium]|nr:hypothetical protein [Oscillospiraceae bacterium]